MHGAVTAIWFHTQSTDDNPDNDFCTPEKIYSVGFRGVGKGTSDYEHAHPLPGAVAKAIHPVLEALSSEDLLRRCLLGSTQNRNEALNTLM